MRTLSQQRRDQSLTDELTGLRNRRYLTNILDAYFAEFEAGITSRSLAFLFVDLDRFKEVNDTFGHPAGDQLLAQFGPRLLERLRDGGPARPARRRRVRRRCSPTPAPNTRPTSRSGSPMRSPSRSSSARCRPTSAPASESPWRRPTRPTAPRCCGAPTSPCTGRSSAASPSRTTAQDLDKVGNRIQLLDELQSAIDEHQLVLYYQPQLDLRTGEMLSAEGADPLGAPDAGRAVAG